MNPRVVILSLRFNPGFLSFLKGYARAIQALGGEATFLLDEGYRGFPQLEDVAPILGAEALRERNWTHAIFLNPSIENRAAAEILRERKAKILYVLHEPWQISLNYLRVEGLVSTLRGIMAHGATVPVLKLSDTVLIPSQYGLKVYERTDARFNPHATCMPLIIDDEAPPDVAEAMERKRYFGFIGALNRSHGFDQYVGFMRRMLAEEKDLHFLVASRQPFPAAIGKERVIRENADRVEIRCGKPLSDEEIDLCYANCFCIWNLYRRSTQSGVLPKAFMFGTPVVASRVGSFPEYVVDGVNGRFADPGDANGIRSVIAEIRSNLAQYAVNCRWSFRNTFYYEAQLPILARLIS